MLEKEREKQIFEQLPVPQALRIMIMPAIMSQIIVLIYNMADTFYLGKTNNPYMVAGTSLILPVFNLVLSFSGLTGVGGGTLISNLLGKRRDGEAKKVSFFSFYLSLVIASLFSISFFFFAKPILSFLGAGERTYTYAYSYMFCVVVLGGIPTVLSNVLSSLVRSIGLSKQAGFGITMGGILNIILDPIFMFILLRPGNEVLGVGIATLLSNCIACLYFVVIILSLPKDSVLTFSPRYGLPERENIKNVFLIGFPSAFNTLLFDLDYMILDKLMAAYSDISLAAIGIVLKVERLPLNIGIGICQGMIPLISYNHAAGNKQRMHDVVSLSRKTGLTMSVLSVILYELFAAFIIRFFIIEAQTLPLAESFLRIRILATPFMFIAFFTVFFFQSVEKGLTALSLGITRWLVFNIPLLYLLNFMFGMYGLVWTQLIADLMTAIVSILVFNRYRRNHMDELA